MVQMGSDGKLVVAEVEEVGKVARSAIGVTGVRQLGVRISQFVEEWMHHGIDG